MKKFIRDLEKMRPEKLYTVDNFQDSMAAIKVWGDGIQPKTIQKEPVRYFMIVFGLLERGYMDLRIDYRDHHLEAGTFLHINPSHVIEKVVQSPDLKLHLIVVTDDFLQENRTPDKPFPHEFLLSSRHSPATRIPGEQLPMLLARLKGLRHDIRRTDHMFQKILVRNDFTSFIFEMGDIIHRQWKEQPVSYKFGPKEEVMAKFMLLLVRNCRQEHNVSWYADQLCMTPEHLSRILKEISGQTANKWMARVLLTEAKIVLKSPKISIQQIAEELGFADQSSFSKFFKKHTAISPLGYREEYLNR